MSLIVDVSVNRREDVGVLAVTNVSPVDSDFEGACEYIAYLYLGNAMRPDQRADRTAYLTHVRSDGAWVLLRKALNALDLS